MKLCFSTLGCPSWHFSELVSTAADLGYNGIEIRGIADQIYAPAIRAFSDARIEDSKARIARANLEIPILTSGAYFFDQPDENGAIVETKEYILLAEKLGVPYVRVLGDKGLSPDFCGDMKRIAGIIRELCDYAAEHGVMLLVETNGVLANSNTMCKFLAMVDSPSLGVLWDVHHPYRTYGEAPATTVAKLGKQIRHVHIKDSSVLPDGTLKYQLTGHGDMPIAEAVTALRAIGYNGHYSYEWVKRWAPDLAEPGIAFYQYLHKMKELDL